jgi:hypothetical protein
MAPTRGDDEVESSMSTKALPCIVCGTELESFRDPNQPLGGLAFATKGHYGSTVFDAMDGSTLEITICDACLTKAMAAGRVLHYEPPTVVRGRFARYRGHASEGMTTDEIMAATRGEEEL